MVLMLDVELIDHGAGGGLSTNYVKIVLFDRPGQSATAMEPHAADILEPTGGRNK